MACSVSGRIACVVPRDFAAALSLSMCPLDPVRAVMPHNARGCIQMSLGSHLRFLHVIKVAVFLLYAQCFLILEKHNALIRENKGFHYFPTVIPQHVSIKLLWLWVVSRQSVCF